MLEIAKSPKAESDLEAIWLYSFQQWGEIQADKYFDALISAINGLIEFPELGKPADQIRLGYRSLQVNHHLIFYRLDKNRIVIVRVLHEQMLPDIHL